jgi:hypothetical protein
LGAENRFAGGEAFLALVFVKDPPVGDLAQLVQTVERIAGRLRR